MDDVTRRRLAHNEALFREVNEQVRAAHPPQDGETIAFVCECSDRDCAEKVHLTARRYEEVRAEPDRFVLVPGHEMPGLEHVVAEGDDHTVVEKDVAA